MVKYAYVVDLDRCMGCRACMAACKVENNTQQGFYWMFVFKFEEGEYPNSRISYLPRPCMHCDSAPCIKVCPAKARYKRSDGFVLVDKERCIGCRYCMVACPYGVNYFNGKKPEKNQYYEWDKEGKEIYGSGSIGEEVGSVVPPYKNPDLEKKYGGRLVAGSGPKGVVEKCTWCVHRVERGLKPACVANCPVHALYFGDLEDPDSDVSKILAKKRSFRLLEEKGTNPSVYYVGGAPPSRKVRSVIVIKP
jgi:molybdopterin-containing oxidoreductase family iron-sulfur binding subunit